MIRQLLIGFALALSLGCSLSYAQAPTNPSTQPAVKSPPAQSSLIAGKAYRIAPSDAITITVVDQPELGGPVRVDGDGTISFPHIGRLSVANMTQEQVAALIASRLKTAGILSNAQVVVTITSYGRQISVLGQVGLPGVYPIDRPETLSDVLARAGGVKGDNAAPYLVLKRVGPDGNMTTQQIDVNGLLSGATPSLDQPVDNGETIYVPLAPIYYLSGYVNRPGVYPMNKQLTVEQALVSGGGVRDTGSENRTRIKRVDENGQMQELSAKLDDIVQPNDILIVPESWF
jgi:polysaccharide export outer membrane protein